MASVTKTAGTVANLIYNPDGFLMSAAWTSPTNAQGATDATYATSASTGGSTFGGTWYSLYASNFGFTTTDIPVGSTINSVMFRVRRKNVQGGTKNINDQYIYIVLANGTKGAGTNQASSSDWAGSDEDKDYGPGLMGLTPLDTDVIHTNFGMHFNYKYNGSQTMGASHTAYVDSIECTVDFTAPGGGGQSATLDAISSAESLGAPVVTSSASITVGGIASVGSLGAPSITGDQTITVGGIASAGSLGAPVVTQGAGIVPSLNFTRRSTGATFGA